jgi:HSF-type DNA-binding
MTSDANLLIIVDILISLVLNILALFVLLLFLYKVNPDDSEPVLKRYPICPPIPLQRMLREKGIAVSDYSNSFVTSRLRQASASMAAAAASQSDKLRSTLTPLDESSLKLLLNNGVGGGQACFPLKLHRVLQHLAENGHDDIMSWLPNGRAFVIRDLDRFVTELMPVYFHRMSKFNSFTRQIHMYHFKQVQGGPDKFAYRHDYFLRDEPDLCLQIQRTRKVRDAVVTPSEESDDTKPPPTTLALPQEHDDCSCPSMAVVTPTKADTTAAAVDLIALECMMREQGQGCAVYTSKPAASSKRSRKASTPTKKKQKTKPKTTTPMPSPTSIAESVNHVMMPMMPWSPTHTPESLDSILSTSPKTAKYSWPLRLQRLLDKHEAEGDDQIISWLPHGHSFAVHDPVKFLAEIMPVYFRHSTKFNSFTRQLYEYSFRRYSSGKYKSVFYHPHFLRGQPHEALKISRIRRYKDGKSLVPEIPTADPALFDQLALPRIAAGATIDVPADPLADAKRKATTTSSSLTASSSSIDGPTLDDFAIFDEDELELGLWREALDQYADV